LSGDVLFFSIADVFYVVGIDVKFIPWCAEFVG
jgi:hypothetical protein